LLLSISIIIIYYKNLTFVLIYFVKSLIAPKELRETLPSPLYNVKQLKLKLYGGNPRYRDEVIELVDALLWISPLLEILLIEWKTDDLKDEKISFMVRIAYVHF
jgi:hypothetical protein